MKNPFKDSGFDTLIGTGTIIIGNMMIEPGCTAVVDGRIAGELIAGGADLEDTGKTVLVVRGTVEMSSSIHVHNVTVSGHLKCKTLIVNGQLSVKNGAKITAETIKYRALHVESGAILLGQMIHLDHVQSVSE